jgi:exodeoxyribonuclease V beta subunit
LLLPEGVGEAFRRLLLRPLGDSWSGACLNDYARGGVEVSSEMRFTLPLNPAPSDESILRSLSALVEKFDPVGPFVEYFKVIGSGANTQTLTEGYLTGSIDLVAPSIGGPLKFHILDYKSNGLTLGRDFSPINLIGEMAASGYPLQALLYSIALHRHLGATFPGYKPEQHLGGATYFYLRGASLIDAAQGEGVFHWPIPAGLTVCASNLLAGRRL